VTPNEEAVLTARIDDVLKRYGIVQFEGAGEKRFGVWRMALGQPHLIAEGMSLADAHALIQLHQSTAIIRLIKEHAPYVRAAD
jgi:hypothetical protein